MKSSLITKLKKELHDKDNNQCQQDQMSVHKDYY